jgi:hypothetical protein
VSWKRRRRRRRPRTKRLNQLPSSKNNRVTPVASKSAPKIMNRKMTLAEIGVTCPKMPEPPFEMRNVIA